MMQLRHDEMETHLCLNAADRSTWHIYSDDPVMQRRLEKIGAELTKVMDDGFGREYRLPAKQVSLRKPVAKNKMTPEQRAAARERMFRLRELRKTGISEEVRLK